MTSIDGSSPELYADVKRLSEEHHFERVWQLLSQLPREQLLRDPQLAMYAVGALERLYRSPEASKLIQELEPFVKAAGDANALRRWQNGYAIDLTHQGRIAEAKELLTECLRSAEETEDYRSVAFACNSLGIIEATVGEADFATQYFRRAVAAWQRIGDGHSVGLGHFNLAVVSREWGRLLDASKHFFLAQEYLDAHGTERDIILTRLERTMLLIAFGDIGLAVTAARYTYRRTQELGVTKLHSRAERVLGAALVASGDWKEAEGHLKSSLAAVNQEPDRAIEAHIHEDLAFVARVNHRWEEFEHHKSCALRYFERIGATRHVFRAIRRLEIEGRKLKKF